jgi:mannose-6-phosphate isomerase-like protein (cupin superfamily)
MRMMCLSVFALVALTFAIAQQPSVEAPSWGPKLEPAQYPPGHRPHTKLTELRAKHKGKGDWRETIVNDDYFKAEYISMAPGAKVSPRFHPDTRIWWIVMDGQIRFEIEGQSPFVAGKGALVQVPMQTIYSMEGFGETPSLRFEVSPARGKTLYPEGVTPPEMPGVKWLPVRLNRKAQPYGYENKPHINFFELTKDPQYRGGRFVHDDRGVANIIYGLEKNLPPLNPNDKGHYHPECAEFWLILTGKVRYPIEKVGTIIAEQGDVVYVPPFTFHAPRHFGDAPSCRLAMNGYPNIAHLREAH